MAHRHDHQHQHGNAADFRSYVARLEAPERAAWQKPDEVVARLALEPGHVACEIGAGSGYFTLRLSQAVGRNGIVYAVDVDPRILSLLRERLGADVRNVVPVLGLPDDPLIPAASCHRILMVDTLHHLADPVAYLKKLVRLLRPRARIVNVDFDKRPTPTGPQMECRVGRAEFIALAQKAGLQVVAEHDLLPHQYFIELAVATR